MTVQQPETARRKATRGAREYSAPLALMMWALLVSVTGCRVLPWAPVVLVAVVLTIWDLHRNYRGMRHDRT